MKIDNIYSTCFIALFLVFSASKSNAEITDVVFEESITSLSLKDGSSLSTKTLSVCLKTDNNRDFVIPRSRFVTKNEAKHEYKELKISIEHSPDAKIAPPEFVLSPQQDVAILFGSFLSKGREKGIVYLINPEKQSITEFDAANLRVDGRLFPRGQCVWLSEDLLLMKAKIGGEKTTLIDIKKKETRIIPAGISLVFDKKIENHTCIWGENTWFLPYHSIYEEKPRHFDNVQESIFLRYNNYWVYPEPLEAWLTLANYYSPQRKVNKNISDVGVILPEKSYDLSPPVFLGDTEWVGFVEQVYARSKVYTPNTKAKLLETNFVAVDAHRVSTNPPDKKDIEVKKIKTAPILNVELSYNTQACWNEETKCLELWSTENDRSIKTKKISEVPVSFDPLALGQPKSFDDVTSGGLKQ